MAFNPYDPEAQANYFAPSAYANLTFHNQMFEANVNQVATPYIPLTAAKLDARTNVIPFIVGVLPPATRPSGNMLDRSYTVGDMSKTPIDSATVDQLKSAATGDRRTYTQLGPDGQVARTPTPMNGYDAYAAISQAWYTKFNEPIPDKVWPLLLTQWKLESGNGQSVKNYNFCNTKQSAVRTKNRDPYYQESAAEGAQGQQTTQDSKWASFSSPAEGALYFLNTLNGATVAALRTGDVNKYGQALERQGFHTAGDGYTQNLARDVQGVQQNGPGYASTSTRQGQKVIAEPASSSATGDSGGAFHWSTKSALAGIAAAQRSKKVGTATFQAQDGNQTSKGAAYQRKQAEIIKAIQDAWDTMDQTPPLQLLINPQGFKVASSKLISDGNWGRNGAGVGIEHWGDNQDTISASGRVAGFFARATTQGVDGPGLTRMARQFSASYANLMSLYLLYRNNGYLFTEDYADTRTVTSKPTNLAMVGSIYIYYDRTLYIGSFDSFELTEEDTAPFTLSYSFEFTVRTTYLLDNLPITEPGTPVTGGVVA